MTGEPAPKANGRDRGIAPKITPKKIVTATFEYHDQSGDLVYVVERVEHQNADGTFVLTEDGKRKKTFRQRRPDPEHPGKWLWNVEGVPVAALPAAAVDEGGRQSVHPVLVVEGERKVDLLWSWNIAATMQRRRRKESGSRSTLSFCRGADVVLLPDNDDAGLEAHQ